MEAYKSSLAKLTPEKLVNTLLTLNEEFKNIVPEDKALADAVRAKIEAVKEQISGLKRDRSPSVRTEGRAVDRAADAEKLERSRSGHLAQITILSKKFDALLETLSSLTEESDRSEATIQLDQITSALNYQLTQVENKSNKLELILNEDALAELVTKNAAYSEKVFKCRSELAALKEHEKNRVQRQAKAVLPNISITKFVPKGKLIFQEFQSFKASFESLFIENNFYSKVQLFNYLISFLGGTALELCMRYAVMQDFEGAYKELCAAYDRPDLLITECLTHLEEIEKPKGTAASMRNLYLKQNQTVALLFKFIKDKHKVDEALLLRSLICKVPYSFDKQYREYLEEREGERQKDLQILTLSLELQTMSSLVGHTSSITPSDVPTEPISSNVQAYFTFFEKYLYSLEYLEILHPKTSRKDQDNEKFLEKKRKGVNFTTVSKPNYKKQLKNDKGAVKSEKNIPEKFCYLCKEKSHFTAYCKKDIPIKKKWEIFSKNNLCFNCGRRGHVGKECIKSSSCDRCSIKHLPILHYTPNSNQE